MMKQLFFLLLVCSTVVHAYAYSDYDVDGVDDRVDQCLNTPFDVLVDETGCDIQKSYVGVLDLSVGTLYTQDSQNKSINNLLFSTQYTYKKWDISLSTYKELASAFPDRPNALYTTITYNSIVDDKTQVSMSAGTKQLKNQDDYYVGLNVNYQVTPKQDFSAYYSYTAAQDSPMQSYDTFHTFPVGTGRYVSQRWYSKLSYNYIGASSSQTEAYQALNWENIWMLTTQTYLTGTYSYGLSQKSTKHTLSLQIGIRFD